MGHTWCMSSKVRCCLLMLGDGDVSVEHIQDVVTTCLSPIQERDRRVVNPELF